MLCRLTIKWRFKLIIDRYVIQCNFENLPCIQPYISCVVVNRIYIHTCLYVSTSRLVNERVIITIIVIIIMSFKLVLLLVLLLPVDLVHYMYLISFYNKCLIEKGKKQDPSIHLKATAKRFFLLLKITLRITLLSLLDVRVTVPSYIYPQLNYIVLFHLS